MKFSTQSSGGGNGLIQDKPLITGIELKYNEINQNLMKPFDVQLNVKFEKPAGRDFEPTMTFEGNFDRSATNDVVGDKDMYKIRQLLAAVGVTEFEVSADGRFPDNFFEVACIGKRISLIKYIYDAKKQDDGTFKARWKNWWKVYPEAKAAEQLAEFTKKTSNSAVKGFIKDFKPTIADEKNAAAQGATAAATATAEAGL